MSFEVPAAPGTSDASKVSDAPNAIAIRVQGVSKRYDVYEKPADRLKQMVVGRLCRLVRRQAPKYHREFWALRPLDLAIRKGETVGIVGRNGSGKSTLLQLICGTLSPTTGAIERHGRIAALLELGAGFNAEFTGEENIRLSGLLYGISESDLARRFDDIVRFSELGPFIKQPVKTYSSGMYVRLAFAIAAHVDADVLIIDEALSVGDVRFAQRCARFLRDFQQRGTLLFVSHDLSAVINLCSRAIWLDEGRLQIDDTSKSVVESYLAEQHAQDRATSGVTMQARTNVVGKASARLSVEAEIDIRLRDEPSLSRKSEFVVFEFDPHAGEREEFGERRLEIVNVELSCDSGKRKVFGGEIVTLTITAMARADAEHVIFGFYIKDRLGQRLIGDNSYLKFLANPVRAKPGEAIAGAFRFRMPTMPAGDYTVDVAVATGSQHDHTQQHWIHDSVTFHSTDETRSHGLVGIPMLAIDISHVNVQV